MQRFLVYEWAPYNGQINKEKRGSFFWCPLPTTGGSLAAVEDIHILTSRIPAEIARAGFLQARR